MSAQVLGGCRPVSDLDVHHNVFQIVRLGPPCFFTEHTMHALLSLFSLVFLSRRCAVIAALFRKLESRRDNDLLRDFLINRRHIVAATSIIEKAHHGEIGGMKLGDAAPLSAS